MAGHMLPAVACLQTKKGLRIQLEQLSAQTQ